MSDHFGTLCIKGLRARSLVFSGLRSETIASDSSPGASYLQRWALRSSCQANVKVLVKRVEMVEKGLWCSVPLLLPSCESWIFVTGKKTQILKKNRKYILLHFAKARQYNHHVTLEVIENYINYIFFCLKRWKFTQSKIFHNQDYKSEAAVRRYFAK